MSGVSVVSQPIGVIGSVSMGIRLTIPTRASVGRSACGTSSGWVCAANPAPHSGGEAYGGPLPKCGEADDPAVTAAETPTSATGGQQGYSEVGGN